MLKLKLKLQYFGYGPTHWKRLWWSARLKAGGEGDDRQWDGWMASLTQWTWVWANSRRWWGTGRPGMPPCVHGVTNSWTWLNNCTTTTSLWVTNPAGMGFDFIVIVPLLPSPCRFFFVFGHGESFFGRFQHPPVDGCSTASCDFGALSGGDEWMSFYSAILNRKPYYYLSLCMYVMLLFFPSTFQLP